MTEENAQIKEVDDKVLEDILGTDFESEEKESEEIVVVDPKDLEKEELAKEDNNAKEKDGYLDKKLNQKINNRVDARVNRMEKQLEKKLVAEREAYVTAIATVQERMQEALDKNNLKEYNNANQALDKLRVKKEEIDSDIKEIKEEVKEENAKKVPDFDEPATRWLNSNKKFVEKIDSDPELSAMARSISTRITNGDFKGRSQIDILAEVKKQLMERMPNDFKDIATKDELPSVSGGKMDIGNSGGKKVYTINDVPALDRQILKNYVNAKVYKDEKEAVQKYFQRKSQENR